MSLLWRRWDLRFRLPSWMTSFPLPAQEILHEADMTSSKMAVGNGSRATSRGTKTRLISLMPSFQASPSWMTSSKMVQMDMTSVGLQTPLREVWTSASTMCHHDLRKGSQTSASPMTHRDLREGVTILTH